MSALTVALAYLLSGACMSAGVAYLVGFLRGFKRGREVERMEPPRLGDWHFREGPIQVTYADSASDAITTLMKQSYFVAEQRSRDARRGTDGA